jgi:hypothetical protein
VEDIADGLVDLGFDIISVKQMSTARHSWRFQVQCLASVPCNPAKDGKVPRYFQTVQPLPYFHQGRVV